VDHVARVSKKEKEKKKKKENGAGKGEEEIWIGLANREFRGESRE